MTKKYDIGFKQNCVQYLRELKIDGIVKIAGISEPIENVRDLVKALGISSYTLYKWDKEIEFDLDEVKVKKEKKVQGPKVIIEPEISIDSNLFGLRYYSWFAKANKIKGYSRMNLNQLKLKIGMQLIRESGLVKTRVKPESMTETDKIQAERLVLRSIEKLKKKKDVIKEND